MKNFTHNSKVYLLIVSESNTHYCIDNTFSSIKYDLLTTDHLLVVYKCQFKTIKEARRFATVNEIRTYSIKSINLTMRFLDV